ncbi:MAG: hypothetical protein KDC54_03185 [Lewinella sp.]|nr:hypothetical protein [Lewinella sp.]
MNHFRQIRFGATLAVLFCLIGWGMGLPDMPATSSASSLVDQTAGVGLTKGHPQAVLKVPAPSPYEAACCVESVENQEESQSSGKALGRMAGSAQARDILAAGLSGMAPSATLSSWSPRPFFITYCSLRLPCR